MLQLFEFTKICMGKNAKRHFSRNFDIFSIKMTYLKGQSHVSRKVVM